MPDPVIADVATRLARGTALLAGGKIGEALELLADARRHFPGDAGIAGRHADALQLAGRPEEAIAGYQLALGLDKSSAESWYGLGCAQLALKAYGTAARALHRAVALQPAAGGPNHNLAKALFELGHADAAITHFRRAALAGDPELAGLARHAIACIIPGSPAADHAAVLRARQEWLGPAPVAPRPHAAPARGRKLRIGYLSAFFDARNWMKPVWGLINQHDRAAFELHMFSDGGDPTAASGYRDWPDDYVHDIGGMPDARVAGIMVEIGIDVLVDLNGYSFQDRLRLLMLRPAPVIVQWFNMFATSGVAAVDWLVGDAAVIRPDEERHYVERIHRLPGSYLAFQVRYPVPPVVPPPALAAGRITLGCLGSQHKITDPVLQAWGRILRAAPAAALLIRNGTLEDASTRADLLGRLERQGVAAARVTLEGRAAHFEFLRAYDRIDIALDTFPYNGGTTTMEALWQGVPVLAFDGDRWASRTSRSLLLAAGLGEWVADDVDGYVRLGSALATDPGTPARLAALRAELRDRLRAAPVCDSAALCSAMEAFYREVTGQEGGARAF